jgi:hypothetical protein
MMNLKSKKGGKSVFLKRIERMEKERPFVPRGTNFFSFHRCDFNNITDISEKNRRGKKIKIKIR